MGIFCIALGSGLSSAASNKVHPLVDLQEETLHYQFGWNGIPAADAIVTTYKETLKGRPFYRFSAKAWTKKYIDWLYGARAKGEALVSADKLEPISLRFFQKVGRKKVQLTIQYDHDQNIANAVVIKNKKKKIHRIRFRHATDIVTIPFLLNNMEKVGDRESFEVVTARSAYRVRFEVMKKEEIKVGAGKFNALLLKPDIDKLREDGKKKKKYKRKYREILLWVSDDPRHYLLKAKSDLLFGHVYGELVKIVPTEPDTSNGAGPAGASAAGL